MKGNEVVVAASINDSSKDRFVVTVTVAGPMKSDLLSSGRQFQEKTLVRRRLVGNKTVSGYRENTVSKCFVIFGKKDGWYCTPYPRKEGIISITQVANQICRAVRSVLYCIVHRPFQASTAPAIFKSHTSVHSSCRRNRILKAGSSISYLVGDAFIVLVFLHREQRPEWIGWMRARLPS